MSHSENWEFSQQLTLPTFVRDYSSDPINPGQLHPVESVDKSAAICPHVVAAAFLRRSRPHNFFLYCYKSTLPDSTNYTFVPCVVLFLETRDRGDGGGSCDFLKLTIT
ncbi:hypothetical protein L596_005891 [Steinernema carpocapsae]|uniref:Uncharacterized protein n=1 Tax=Steinernema carpocapsae TaxID=34508 RepID=A0A4V6I8R8_STECR|nr:hypothetical protein L596_005891 [Steinernema carpocapsae]